MLVLVPAWMPHQTGASAGEPGPCGQRVSRSWMLEVRIVKYMSSAVEREVAAEA